MKSAILLGLTGLAANVNAHPHQAHQGNMVKRGVDISNYAMPDVSRYSSSEATDANPVAASLSKRATYVETATDFVKQTVPGAEFRIVNDHYTGSNGISHVNFKQQHNGIDVDNGDFHVNVGRDGSIFSFGNNFFDGKLPDKAALNTREYSNPVDALNGVINTFGLSVDAANARVDKQDGEKYTFTETKGTVSQPSAQLVYLSKGDGNVALTWKIETDVESNWLVSYVDAKDTSKVHNVVDYVDDFATMEVFDWNLIDPGEGDRKVLTDPWNAESSPFTWFSDGTTNYTTTRGNNAIAQSNPTGQEATYLNLYRPNSAERKFEYPYTNDKSPKEYVDASITQLFYTSNLFHDVVYKLGFTEAAGNFQVNNNGKGGKGQDSVILHTQDGSDVNNANFATPPDGQMPRMRMYLFTTSTPNRDSSFDQSVVVHEYTHGISNRLTGGPANTKCLSTTEARGLGEGWSDFMAYASSIRTDDNRNSVNNFGHWISEKPKGIRRYPYSTDMTVNPLVYSNADGQTSVHFIGTIWATALWEVIWNLIDKHGNSDATYPTFDANGVPTDGRFLAQKLVLDGMALQPCNPHMLQARDAILDADKNLTGGQNKCELWKGFAKRGLGVKATYALSKHKNDYTLPADCA